jgi:hypothetical protein
LMFQNRKFSIYFERTGLIVRDNRLVSIPQIRQKGTH